MRYRKFGNTGLQVSEIGFGAWAIGGGAMIGDVAIGWGNADDQTSLLAIDAAYNAGINFFDTADIYGLGHSEELLGKAFAGNKNVVIATKVGNVNRNETFTTDYSREHIILACERSLLRLKRDTIDYYQLHTARLQHLQEGICIEAMQFLQQQGKIRYWGLSLNTFDPEPEAAFLLKRHLGQGFQLVLNVINQRALKLVHESSKNGYGIIARMPLQFGLLTGKFHTATTFNNNDHRQKRLNKEVITATNQALEPVWALCKKYNCSKTALALSYILSYDGISTVIPGMRTAEQVADNTTGLFQLEMEDLQLIEARGTDSFASLLTIIQQQG